MITKQLEKCDHILYFTGSMTSKALLILLVNEKQPLTKVLFLNSGNENRPTLDNVKWAKTFCESNQIEFKIVTKKQLIKSRINPSGHQYIYVGIRRDEMYRIRNCYDKNVTKIYPLVERDMTTKQCLEIIKRFEEVDN